jgi:iron complex transport system substrate-binding protein
MARSLAPIRVVLPLLAAFAAIAAAAEPAAPRRVVSFNLCADQLVLALADPAQIAGVSPYATNPAISVVAERARAFRRVEWQAESIIPLNPDLVLTGQADRAVSKRMLTSLGFRTVEVALVRDIPAALAQIQEVAALLGQPQRGEELIAEVDAARARLAAVRLNGASTALLVGHAGYTAGPSSLAAALVAAAGLQPPKGAPGGYGGFVSLEHLIALHPDVLVIEEVVERPDTQGNVYLTHPALRALYPPSRRLLLPARYTMCGGQALPAALDYLTAALQRMAAETR